MGRECPGKYEIYQTAYGLDRCASAPALIPSFSVFSEPSAVDPQDNEPESNHRGLKALRESLDIDGICWSCLDWKKLLIYPDTRYIMRMS